MKFSVVIPLYNKERHVKRCIISVLNQSHKDFEVIVVDDGSIDNSYNIAKEIQDSRISIIRQKNKGVSSARNIGIQKARNKYIAFLDADDEWCKDNLNTISILIKKYPEANIYSTAFQTQQSQSKTIPSKQYTVFEKGWNGIIDDYFKHSLIGSILCSSSAVVTKAALMSVGGFPVGITTGEDTETWCKLALDYKIAYYNKVCVTYHEDAENRSVDKPLCLEKSFVSYIEKKYIDNKKYDNVSKYFKEYMIAYYLRKKIALMIYNKQTREMRKTIKKYFLKTSYLKKMLVFYYVVSLLPYEKANALYKRKNGIRE